MITFPRPQASRIHSLFGTAKQVIIAVGFIILTALLAFSHIQEGLSTAEIMNWIGMLLAILMLAVRATYQKNSAKRFPSLLLAIISQSFLFASFHLDNGQTFTADFINIYPRLIGGFVLGYIAWRYGMRMSILAHMLNNLIATQF